MKKTTPIKLSAGQEIHCNFFWENGSVTSHKKEIKGFSAIGIHFNNWGVYPFFSERNWYAAGYQQGDHIIYLQDQKLLPKALVFELVRLGRHGRIFFWDTPNDKK